MDDPLLDLASIQALGAAGGYAGVFSLSDTSVALVLSALDILRREWFWFTDVDKFDPDDWDTICSLLADVQAGLEVSGEESVRVCSIYQEIDGSGGASIAGTQTRLINTIVGDVALAPLVGDGTRFKPIAGDYFVSIAAPAFKVNTHRCHLGSSDAPWTDVVGLNAYALSTLAVQTFAFCRGFFTTDGTKRLHVRHYTQMAQAVNGLGVGLFDAFDDIYTFLTLTKVG